jgi:hypothetical protein
VWIGREDEMGTQVGSDLPQSIGIAQGFRQRFRLA